MRLRIGIVGAGKVGAVLGAAWRVAGHELVAVSAQSTASLERADVMLPGVPVVTVEEVVRCAEVVLLSVPDDSLPGLVAGLAQLGNFSPGQVVVHPAGRYGAAVLTPAVKEGALGIALHPAMTFTGTSLDLARLSGCPIAVTAAPTVAPIGQALAVECGGEPFVVPEGHRVIYHAALTHGANHLVTLVAQAVRIAAVAGVDGPALRPLLTAALERALTESDAALTGPVARGDIGTVTAHIAALEEAATVAATEPDTPNYPTAEALAEALQTYRDLAGATVRRARQLGALPTYVADEIAAVLKN